MNTFTVEQIANLNDTLKQRDKTIIKQADRINNLNAKLKAIHEVYADDYWIDARKAVPDHSALVAVIVVEPGGVIDTKMAWYGARSNSWTYTKEFDAGFKVMSWIELPEFCREAEATDE